MKLRDACDIMEISPNAMARLLDVEYKTVKKILDGKPVREATIQKINGALAAHGLPVNIDCVIFVHPNKKPKKKKGRH